MFSEAANAALRICDWPRSGRYAAALKKHVIDETSVINPLVFITYCDEPALQLRCSQSYLKDKIPEPPSPIHAGGRRRPGKARIAYLSADFHGHATSYSIAELFERQDRKRFELFGISFGADDGGEMRRRLAEAFDHFHDVRGRDDLEVAKLLNELEIDIIVDLKGYTQNSRFGIFAHRPAPIQVSYLGFFEDPALQLQCARAFLKHKMEDLPAHIERPKARRHRKPRIAYLSADFREHAVSYLIAELFEQHDRSRFEVFGISFGADDKSPMRARLVKAFDHFHDVRRRGDREIAELLGELGVDIAVDLNGHTRDDRFRIFAHRPAPIQVSYLGY